jgi:hypothetical protein
VALTFIAVRRPVRWLFTGRLILGVGMALVALAPTVTTMVIASALMAVGGPVGDVPLMLIMQHDLPRDQLGKVYSLRTTLESGGVATGLWLAAPLFFILPHRAAVLLCAFSMFAAGLLGLWRFAERQ